MEQKLLKTLRVKLPSKDPELNWREQEVKLDISSTTHGVLDRDRVGIEIGGRNLFTSGGWEFYSPFATLVSYDGTKSLIFKETLRTTFATVAIKNVGYVTKPGQYIMSGFLKINGEIPEEDYFLNITTASPQDTVERTYDPATGYFTVSQVVGGYSWTILATARGKTSESNRTIEISDFKYEKGNVATDWTPAPEDVPIALTAPTAGVPFLIGHNGTASSFGKIATHGTTYDVEIGEKGLKVDGQIVDKDGYKVLGYVQYIPDTRRDNQPPSWYYANYSRGAVTEFKNAKAIGLNNASGNYVSLYTNVRWTDTSGSGITQLAYGNNNEIYYRTSSNTTSWLPWEQLSTNKKGAVSRSSYNTIATNISTVNYNDYSLQRVSILPTQTITVSSDNATVVVQGSLVAQVSSKTVYAKVKLGNSFSIRGAITNRNVPHTLIVNEVFTGVSKGDHTVELVWGTQDNSGTGTIPAYTTTSIVAWEL